MTDTDQIISRCPTGKIRGVYRIVNSVTGKSYVGKSLDIYSRWRCHVRHLEAGVHHATKLQRSWKKYGRSVFWFEVLLLCDNNDTLLVEEERFIQMFNSYHYGYNGTLRGRDSTGTKRSKEFREGCTARKTGLRHSEETRRRMSLARIGKEVSAETREKRRANQTGKQFMLGKKHTEESKEKMRQARILHCKKQREMP